MRRQEQGLRTGFGFKRPKSVYQRNPITLYFNSPVISPASHASSIKEDDHISYGSYVPNDYSLSFSADTVKTMESFEKPADNVNDKTADTFFSKRLLQLKEFRQLHNVDDIEDKAVSQTSSRSTSSDKTSTPQNINESISDIIQQTDKLPTVLRKDFVDNVYTLMVLSQSKKSGEGEEKEENIREAIRTSLLSVSSASSVSPASSVSQSSESQSSSVSQSSESQSSESQVSPQALLDNTITTILSKSPASAASPESSSSSPSPSPLEKAISIASSTPSKSIKSIDKNDITWNDKNKNWTLLHLAVINQKLDDVKTLLLPSDTSDTSDTSDKLPLFEQDTDGLTPLHWAVLKSDTVNGHNILRALLEYIGQGQGNGDISKNIDIISREDKDGITAFKWAIKQSKSAIAKEIIATMMKLSKIKQEKKVAAAVVEEVEAENVEEVIIPEQIKGESLTFSQPEKKPTNLLKPLSNNTHGSIQTEATYNNNQLSGLNSGSQLDDIDLYNIEHSTPKTTILHLIASAMTVPNKPDHDDATISTAASTAATTSASTTDTASATVNSNIQELSSSINTELSDSTVYSLIQTNPSFIITPDESSLTPLHIVSRNIFSPISTLTISMVSSSADTNNNSNASLPSTINSNSSSGSSVDTNNNINASLPSTINSNISDTFEKSIILLQNMMDTIMPVDSSPDYLSTLTLSASSFKDNQGNNPLHELVTSFWKSRLSSISALTQTMNIIEDIRKQTTTTTSPPDIGIGLTFPIISVPALIPLQYEYSSKTNPTIDNISLTFVSQPTRKSILFFNKDKTPTMTLFHSSETSIPLPEYTNISKQSGIDAQFARDFFTPQTSAYSSVEEIFKTLMETEDGLVELPFAEFKNQTNDQGHYPIDTFVDFMTTYDRYLVDNFKFKTAPERVKQIDYSKGEIVLRLNKSAPGKMQGLTNILLLLTPDEDVLKETAEMTPSTDSQKTVQEPNNVEAMSVFETKMLTITKINQYEIKLLIKIPKQNNVTLNDRQHNDLLLNVAQLPSTIPDGDTVYIIYGSFKYERILFENPQDIDEFSRLYEITKNRDNSFLIGEYENLHYRWVLNPISQTASKKPINYKTQLDVYSKILEDRNADFVNHNFKFTLNVDNTINTDTTSEFQGYDISIDLSSIIKNVTTNQIINKDYSLLRMIELLLSPSGEANNDEYKILQQDIIDSLKQEITKKITDISNKKYDFKLTFQKVEGHDSLALQLYVKSSDSVSLTSSSPTPTPTPPENIIDAIKDLLPLPLHPNINPEKSIAQPVSAKASAPPENIIDSVKDLLLPPEKSISQPASQSSAIIVKNKFRIENNVLQKLLNQLRDRKKYKFILENLNNNDDKYPIKIRSAELNNNDTTKIIINFIRDDIYCSYSAEFGTSMLLSNTKNTNVTNHNNQENDCEKFDGYKLKIFENP